MFRSSPIQLIQMRLRPVWSLKKNKKDSFDDMFFFMQTFSLKLKQHTLKQILNTKFYGVYLSFVETSD